ncbi:MAG: hypothetical protein BWY78_01105 [Alphaproteobacteria bacterium ADurb.Bin438]|nr:MAG: hypothetical protein BWY78_01105 [Alphaproteobacteria bacterium ADurb.Bin438]
MKIITVCGSLKFKAEMMEISLQMELLGNVVLIPIFPLNDNGVLSENEINMLGNMHKEKIKLSDAILVVDVNGYIGNSTKNEIALAKSLDKEIIYLSDLVKG